jgi:uncharacterized protein Yka (UPF0111/DUF47 family)
VEFTLKVDKVREEARDLQFELLKELFNEDSYNAKEVVLFRAISERILKVAITAEETGDFIRALAVKHA